MEIRQMRAFVVVAEELHFRRAAARLNMSQPPLSMLIQALEREVGTQLFRRTRRNVELTESGSIFLTEVKSVLAGADRAVAAAREFERGESGRLEIGCTSSAAFNPAIPRLIRIFCGLYPKVALVLTEHNTLTLLQAVSDGKLDAAFLRPPVSAADNVSVRQVLEEDLMVALPAGHSLSSRSAVPLSALEGETILLRPRAVGNGLAEAIVSACKNAGFSPIVGQQAAPQMSSILNLVAAGLGVSVVPASMRGVLPDVVDYRPLDGTPAPRAPIALARRKIHRNNAIKNFVELVETSGDNGEGRSPEPLKDFAVCEHYMTRQEPASSVPRMHLK